MVLASQKGGVGKTTTAVNMAAYFALMGKKTLLVDMDLQGNATTHLGINRRALDKTMFDVMTGKETIENVILQSKVECLDVAPANTDLRNIETDEGKKLSNLGKLKKALVEVSDRYDYVFIDTSPHVGVATRNALKAADVIVIPVSANFYSYESLNLTDELLEGINLDGVPRKYVITMYQKANSTTAVVKKIREIFGPDVAETVIPRAINLSVAPGFGLPMSKKYPKTAGAIAYYNLSVEALKWL